MEKIKIAGRKFMTIFYMIILNIIYTVLFLFLNPFEYQNGKFELNAFGWISIIIFITSISVILINIYQVAFYLKTCDEEEIPYMTSSQMIRHFTETNNQKTE